MSEVDQDELPILNVVGRKGVSSNTKISFPREAIDTGRTKVVGGTGTTSGGAIGAELIETKIDTVIGVGTVTR